MDKSTEHWADRFAALLKNPDGGYPYASHTHRAYNRAVRDFLRFFDSVGGETLCEVNGLTIRQFARHRLQSVSQKTLNQQLIGLRGFFDFLWVEGVIDTNPVTTYRLNQNPINSNGSRQKGGRPPVRLPEVLYSDERCRVTDLLGCDHSPRRIRDVALFGFILDTGLRADELTRVQVRDWVRAGVDGARVFRVIGKGDQERIVHSLDGYGDYIADYLERCPAGDDQPLFRSQRKNRPLTASSIYRIVDDLLNRASITDKRQHGPHLLRHTAASLMVKAGWNLRAVQATLGHRSIQTTEHYLHLL